MGRVKLNRWLIALVAIAMLALVFEPEAEKIQITIDSDHPEADYTMEDVTITQYTINGYQNHKLTAKKMIHYNQQDDEKIEFKKPSNNTEKKTMLNSEVSILVKPIITYKNQQNIWTLSANQGRMTNQQTQLFLAEDVKLTEQLDNQKDSFNSIAESPRTNISKNGIETSKITTSDLKIDLITKMAHTEQSVNLKAQNITVSSIGMIIDMEKSKIHLLANVHTQLKQIKQ